MIKLQSKKFDSPIEQTPRIKNMMLGLWVMGKEFFLSYYE